MAVLDDAELKAVIKTATQIFYSTQLRKLSEDSKIDEWIKTVNPYLQQVKGVTTGEQLAKAIVASHFTASDEGLFGHVMEHIAIYIVKILHDGHKSSIEGVDFQWNQGKITIFIQFKSSWVWGNNDQIKNLTHNFSEAKAQYPKARCYNLCSYGAHKQENKNGYIKMTGADTWEFLTGDPKFHLKLTDLIEPDIKMVAEINAQKDKVILSVIDRLEKIGIIKNDGTINWRRLVDYIS